MHRFALQIRFSDSEAAAKAFDVFPPSGLQYIENWIRRVRGDSQFILLEVLEEADANQFRKLCKSYSGVVEVSDVSEAECRKICGCGE
jgi:hypothetical protein